MPRQDGRWIVPRSADDRVIAADLARVRGPLNNEGLRADQPGEIRERPNLLQARSSCDDDDAQEQRIEAVACHFVPTRGVPDATWAAWRWRWSRISSGLTSALEVKTDHDGLQLRAHR